jgi:hypothetical protein
MGRPPKKRMRESDAINSTDSSAIANLDKEWSPSAIPSETFRLCPPVYLNHLAISVPQDANGQTLQHEQSKYLQPISATVTPWPDFTTTSSASSMLSMDSGFSNLPGELMTMMGTSEAPPCPCLSYLYLCLSTLSTLNSFPISVHTLNSLYTAARTARSVIQCQVCPRSFATGCQNIMMLGTLLSVLADAWLRVSQADAQDLGKQTAPPAYEASITQDPEGAKATWKQWLRQVVRRAVIGGPVDPNAFVHSGLCDQTPDLLALIIEMEERQHRWHGLRHSRPLWNADCHHSPEKSPDQATAQSAEDGATRNPEEGKRGVEKREMLCLKVIGLARMAISRFGFEPCEYPDGVSVL